MNVKHSLPSLSSSRTLLGVIYLVFFSPFIFLHRIMFFKVNYFHNASIIQLELYCSQKKNPFQSMLIKAPLQTTESTPVSLSRKDFIAGI